MTQDSEHHFGIQVLLGTCVSSSCLGMVALLLLLVPESSPRTGHPSVTKTDRSVDAGESGAADGFRGNSTSAVPSQTPGTEAMDSSSGENPSTSQVTVEELASSDETKIAVGPRSFQDRDERAFETGLESLPVRRGSTEKDGKNTARHNGFVIVGIEDDKERRTEPIRRTSVPVRRHNENLDRFGNPTGDDAGLGRKGEFRGTRILLWLAEAYLAELMTHGQETTIEAALREPGFRVEMQSGSPFPAKRLDDVDQLWIVSGFTPILSKSDYDAIETYARAGHGLYVLADNHPLLVEANELAGRLLRTSVTGNYSGGQIVAIGRVPEG